MVDPSLLQSFLEDEWMSIHGLPLFACHPFSCFVGKAFLPTNLLSPVVKSWGCLPHQRGRWATSAKITPLAILVMDGVGKGKLGLKTAFCRTDQGKVEPSDVLLTLDQHESPEPGVEVVKVFTNLLCLPQGSFGSPYLDITPFQWALWLPNSTYTAAFVEVAPLFFHSDCPSIWERGRWAKKLPSPHGDTVGDLREGASLVPPFATVSPCHLSHFNGDVSAQTKEVLNFSLALRQLQEVTQVKAQLEWSWPLNWKSWPKITRTNGKAWPKVWGPVIQDGSETKRPMHQDDWADGHHL